jgi:hypothetical protein
MGISPIQRVMIWRYWTHDKNPELPLLSLPTWHSWEAGRGYVNRRHANHSLPRRPWWGCCEIGARMKKNLKNSMYSFGRKGLIAKFLFSCTGTDVIIYLSFPANYVYLLSFSASVLCNYTVVFPVHLGLPNKFCPLILIIQLYSLSTWDSLTNFVRWTSKRNIHVIFMSEHYSCIV